MKILVGSTNPVKVNAVKSVALRYWPDAVVEGVSVPSGVSHQPRSDGETKRGAVNRARAALSSVKADLGVGLEGGVQEIDGKLFEVGWVAVVDAAGRVHYGASGRFELPKVIADKLNAGGELGPVMDELTGVSEVKKKGGAVAFLTMDVVTRGSLFEQAVAFALSPHANKVWYK